MKNAIPGNWIFRTAPVLGLLFGLLLPGACFAALPPVITSQPTNQTIQCQCSVTFQVTVNSLSALTYQWHKDGAEIPGATSYTYTISSVQMSDEGSYSVNVTNAGGFAISSNAVLTVYTRTAPTLDAS